ncbi:MAG: GNAT family N-acetyltransferase [Clostridia bacterium]|nr:GNAT family N-acetyltransferase [Clostridia bacterium]
MQNTKERYDFFRLCFPGIIRREQTVIELLNRDDMTALERREQGELTGILLYSGNIVYLFCVHPDHRHQGIGSTLLSAAEEEIQKAGYNEIRFCDGNGYLTPGVPIDFSTYEENSGFFSRRGYVHDWGGDTCVDMQTPLDDIPAFPYHIGTQTVTRDGITYLIRFADEKDLPGILACVGDGWPDFSKYYRETDRYKGTGQDRVLLAEDPSGTVLGTLMISCEGEKRGVGSVGCTVTRQSVQRRGIATALVCAGTSYLKEQGLETAYLGYTYSDIIPMYGRAGYKVSMSYMMAVKTFK